MKPHNLRNRVIKLRLTEEEHLQLLKKRGKMRLAVWIRETALHGSPPTIPEVNIAALRELNAIGSNLNQIAKKLNSDETINLRDLINHLSALRAVLIGLERR